MIDVAREKYGYSMKMEKIFGSRSSVRGCSRRVSSSSRHETNATQDGGKMPPIRDVVFKQVLMQVLVLAVVSFVVLTKQVFAIVVAVGRADDGVNVIASRFA